MSDLSITAANVVSGSNAVTEQGVGGATITAGQQVYLDSATGRYKLADSDGATAAIKSPRGTALNGCSDGQPLAVQRSGDITIGATLTAGTTYYLSNTAGGICPLADVGTGETAVIVGIAKSTTVLALGYNNSGVTL